MSLNESIVEDAALEWFGELGYAVGHGPQLAPGEPAAERDSFSEVVLVGRLREAIRRLNPAIPEEAREEALRKALRVATTSLVQTNRAFHRMLRDGVPVEYPRPDGSIAGDRVCLTHVEDKSRAGANGAPPVVLRTVFKLYASLAELRGSAPSVAASGFYGVRNLGTGQVFVNGLTYKGRMDEQVNPLAWARIKAKEPAFFDGERLAPKWDEAG